MSLYKIQQDFYNAVLFKDNAIEDAIVTSNISNAMRINIYRNAIIGNLINALKDSYPVVFDLLGEAYFRQAAKVYIKQYPSQSGDLNQYGEYFADFLQTLPDIQNFNYVVDIARLEWLMLQAFHAQNAAQFDFQKLAKIPAEQYSQLHFNLIPSCYLLPSNYNILTIWQAHKENNLENIQLKEQKSYIGIYRPTLEVILMPLSYFEYLFLQALQQQKNLEAAMLMIQEINQEVSIEQILQKMVVEKVIDGFYL